MYWLQSAPVNPAGVATLTSWPGRWKGTSARTWLREHLRRWSQRTDDGHIWRVVRRLEMGHPFGRHDWLLLGPGMRDAARGVLRDMCASKHGRRAAILDDFVTWLETISAEPEGRTPPPEERCPRCEKRWDGPHSELACLSAQVVQWERRYRAEAGLPIAGWWREFEVAETVWFAELPVDPGRDEPWCVSVWREDPAGPWRWDLSWEPARSHRGERRVAGGTAEVAWLAMERALAAWKERPRGKGVPCSRCYGWGYWCAHGGGPTHACEIEDDPCECTACDGGSTDAARRTEE